MRTILPLFLLGGFCLSGSAADNPTIEDLMTEAELQATGIGSLSTAQREALNNWLQRYLAGEIQSPGQEETLIAEEPVPVFTPVEPPVVHQPVTPAENAEPARQEVPMEDFRRTPERVDFTSRIAGEFSGWTGRTRFTLENGQVWEQRRGRRWKITLDSPEVRIYQNWMGAYEMEVLSEGRSIGVRRIQ